MMIGTRLRCLFHRIEAAFFALGFIGTVVTVINRASFITITAIIATAIAVLVFVANVADIAQWRYQRDYWREECMAAERQLDNWEDETVLNRFATYYYAAAPDDWTEIAPHLVAAHIDLPGHAFAAFFLDGFSPPCELVYCYPSTSVTTWDGEEAPVESLLASLKAYGALAGEQ